MDVNLETSGIWGVTKLQVYMVCQVMSNRIYSSNIFISSLINPVTFNVDVLITVNFICCIYIRGYQRTNVYQQKEEISHKDKNRDFQSSLGEKESMVSVVHVIDAPRETEVKTLLLSLLGDLVWFKEMCEPH